MLFGLSLGVFFLAGFAALVYFATLDVAAQSRKSAVMPDEAEQCTACHGTRGVAAAPFPMLAGQSAEYLISAMTAYRSGERDVAAMAAAVKDLSDGQIERIAHYFAAQSGGVGR